MRAMILSITVLLMGCTTPEYQAQQLICESIWITNLPPKYEKVIRTGYRYIEVPNGRSVCVTKTLENGDLHTVCKEGTREVQIPYTYTTTIDSNQNMRNEQVDICVHNGCLRRYGDHLCRPS